MARTFCKTWWGNVWLQALSHIDYSNRIPRGVSHLCHAEKMEFLVAAINEINQFGTCEPAVNQQVIERYLVAYRILYHIQQLDTLAHEILFLAFGNMTLLITFALITPIPLFRGKPLFLASNLAFLTMKREVEYELRAAITPTQHKSLVSQNTLLVYLVIRNSTMLSGASRHATCSVRHCCFFSEYTQQMPPYLPHGKWQRK